VENVVLLKISVVIVVKMQVVRMVVCAKRLVLKRLVYKTVNKAVQWVLLVWRGVVFPIPVFVTLVPELVPEQLHIALPKRLAVLNVVLPSPVLKDCAVI
jgi:hypothetical protein